MLKYEYNRMNEKIVPDPALHAAVMEKVAPRRRRQLRPAAVIAAVLVVAVMAMPVMAECIPWILERIAPDLVEQLEPVERSDTNNGFTLDVVAASVKGNTAEMVVKLEGEVLAEPVGVMPFLEAKAAGFTCTTTYSIRDYEGEEDDAANGIYYYQVEMIREDGVSVEEILGGEMTVTLSKVHISGIAEENVEVPVILSDMKQLTVAAVADLSGYGFGNFGWADSEEYPYGCELGSRVMVPDGGSLYDVTDQLSLSSAAYIDGKLHIQMAAADMQGKGEWGYAGPYLVDAQGNEALCLYRNLFAMVKGEHRIDYDERIYDIPREELENYTMVVDLTYDNWLTADCEVTFRFSEDEIVEE